jgi:ethanolamine utilization protein EutP (predicted NTPase)
VPDSYPAAHRSDTRCLYVETAELATYVSTSELSVDVLPLVAAARDGDVLRRPGGCTAVSISDPAELGQKDSAVRLV